MPVPNIFASATSAIPLSQLDQNFATAITLGNTAVYLGNTTTSLGNVTLTNVTISSGNVTVTGANVSGTANISTLVTTNDATINGQTHGKGGGNVATNTAVGASALAANQAGGTNNTAIGNAALDANTTGDANTAVGDDALGSNTTASNNTAVGYQAAYTSTTAQQNVAVGQSSLYSTTTGSFNSAVGRTSLYFNTTGASNVAMGNAALESNTTGSFNVGIGQSALGANTTASQNIAVGYQAGYGNTTGLGNTIMGYQAGYTVGAGNNYNTFIGWQAGYAAARTSGNAVNTAIGYAAGSGLTNGFYNTFIGPSSGSAVTTGAKNTIIGGFSGNSGGLNITTSDNYIVLSDGDGNVRGIFDGSGNLLVAKNSSSTATVGFEARANGVLSNTVNSITGVFINRLGDDGSLIDFQQGNNAEGSISVSGTTVSYNGGHLSRWAQTTTAKDESLVKGTVLSNLDAMNVYTDAESNPVDNEQLNKVKVSDVEGDANVAGVFVNWTHDDAHNVDEINMAMTGDMIIRIAQGVTVARGDLLMSAGDGTAKPQGDDIVRSKTVAKVTSTHVTCTYADGSYCVPCVLMAC